MHCRGGRRRVSIAVRLMAKQLSVGAPQGVIVVCSSMTDVASITGPTWSSRPSALGCRHVQAVLPGNHHRLCATSRLTPFLM